MNPDLIKIWRSPESRFGLHVEHPDDLQDETFLAEQTYDDARLNEIAHQGFNAIWIHGQLHHLISNPRFPEFAVHEEQQLNALRKLIARAKEHGINVFLYLQPPRAIALSDAAFWSKHSEVGGQILDTRGDDGRKFQTRSLCTSHPEVLAYLKESFADLTAALPDLGGYLIISASEYPAHCYSGRNCRPNTNRPRNWIMDQVPTNCPRCGEFYPEEIVVRLLQTIRDGVRSVSADLPLIFWNWSWTMYLDPPCSEIIEKLPEDCILMADFERGGRRKDGTVINEYSLGYAGPSEQFRDTWSSARRHGIEVLAKLQLGTTHELGTVCSLPVIGNLFDKARFIRETHLPGFMGCWNFGNLPSANIAAFHFFLDLPDHTPKEKALSDFAEFFFPGCEAEEVVAAWNHFAAAMEFYPFCVPFLYNAPVNHALALLPEPGPISNGIVGRSWLPDERGDDYSQSVTSLFPLEQIISRMAALASEWERGVESLRNGIAHLTSLPAASEYGNAVICGGLWKSAEILYRIYSLKRNWRESHLPEYRRLADAQKENIRRVLPFVERDLRQGLHLEGRFYSFCPESMKKILAEK